MRILILDTYYPPFLRDHYAKRPGLAERSYAEQHRELLDRCFGTSDSYSRHLAELGHETAEIVANCKPLQLAWARENGRTRLALIRTRVPGRYGIAAQIQLLQRIALSQMEAFDPDILYCQDLSFFTPEQLDAQRLAGRLVVGQIASPAPQLERLRVYDLLTTSFPHYVDRFRAAGLDAEYLKIAFFELVLDRLRDRGASSDPRGVRDHRVSFIGGLDPTVHRRGIELLDHVVSEIPLEVWGYGALNLPPESGLRTRYRGEAWGLEMYEVLSKSQISINRHIDAADGYANNMRMFETTGVGSLLLTKQRRTLATCSSQVAR